MKKLIAILFIGAAALLAAPTEASAQIAFKASVANPTQVYANTGADTSTLRLPGATTIQYVVVRNSGTLGGTSILQGSVNGVDFVALDTLTHTNVARSTKIWTADGAKYVVFRIISTGTGTMNATTRHVGTKL